MEKANQNVYAVILAGGSGTRFWPKSRHLTPKQLCKIGDEDLTMLELTLGRLDGFIPPSRRIIVTHKDQAVKTRELTEGLCGHVIAEPMAKNTAPALALAALAIEKLSGDQNPIMISLHADAIIRDTKGFLDTLDKAVKVAQAGYLSLIGVPTKSPETGYGYIESGDLLEGTSGFKVTSFKEKPDLETAKIYEKDPNLFWNSGIFTWQTAVFLAELDRSVPTISRALSQNLDGSKDFYDPLKNHMAEAYASLPKISVDNAILESSKKVAMVAASFDWQDVGSWDALPKTFSVDEFGNCINGDTIVIDSKNSVIDSDGPLVACIGISDTCVIAAKGAILVCPADRAQEVKKIVDRLKETNRTNYL